MFRSGQKILVACEEATKFTRASLINSEDHDTITNALKEVLLPMHPPCSPLAKLKVDPAPCMQSILRTQALQQMSVTVS